uniref:Uncharacterized protein TCIL3000_10_5440 n=1 Tax=Trypanosoma congolense (strain IL3000) TaxID=1068625 RepID=G0UWL2_TRYCI|nr:unnamed protein product [Trypanosoma congolense IL3000]
MESLLSTFDESSTRLRFLYEKARNLGEESGDTATKIDVLRVLHDCFVFHTDTLQDQIDALKTCEEQEVENIEEEVEELEKEFRLLSRIHQGCTSAGHPFPPLNGAPTVVYQTFTTRMTDLSAHLSVMREGMLHLLNLSPACLAKAQSIVSWLGVSDKAAWTMKERHLVSTWNALCEEARAASLALDGPVVEAAHRLLSEVMQLGSAVVSLVEGSALAAAERARGLDDLSNQQRRLVMWCRQQQANLDILREPPHIQEFCVSLVEYYVVMSENYRVILEKAEPYLSEEAVQEWLMEANEAWLHLQVKAIEQLRKTVFDVYPDSPLEEQVEGQAAFCLQLGTFLERLESTLTPRCEGASADCGQCVQLLDDCRGLLKVMVVYEKLSRKLLKLAEHLKVYREVYDCYRTAALLHVTYLSSSHDLLAEATRRKSEYRACVDELQTWAVKKVRCDPWCSILEKVRDIKDLLEKDQQLGKLNGEHSS